MQLLDGVTYSAERRSHFGFETQDQGRTTWRGQIRDSKGFVRDIVLSQNGNAISGLIYGRSSVYEIVPRGKSRHTLIQINQDRFLPCAGAAEIPRSPFSLHGESNRQKDFWRLGAENESVGGAESLVGGPVIDVLIAYTSQVKDELGGTAEAQAFAQSSIDLTNTAYLNSNISPRVRLVGTIEVDYDEASGTVEAARDWARQDPTVRLARDSLKADLVSIIVEDGSDGCGIAFLMTILSPNFEANANSAAKRECAVANLSMTHELGHNQGAAHNPENAGSGPHIFPYAFGHWVNGNFRTVMSYEDPCTSGCERVPHFSNPSVTYNGSPTGVVNEKDNHLVLNNTAVVVSQFREAVGRCQNHDSIPDGVFSFPAPYYDLHGLVVPIKNVSGSSQTVWVFDVTAYDSLCSLRNTSVITGLVGIDNGATIELIANPEGVYHIRKSDGTVIATVDRRDFPHDSVGFSMFNGSITVGAASDSWPVSRILATPTPTPAPTPTPTPTATPPAIGSYPATQVAIGANSVVPPSAPPTGAVRFVVTTESNFKGLLTADPASGVVNITNAHPKGVYPVTVSAYNAGGVVSRTFLLTVVSGQLCNGTIQFSNAPDVSVGTPLFHVGVGDFNSDAMQDFAVINQGTSSVAIRLGNGLGGFTIAPEVSVGINPSSLAIGDMNGDGNQDLIVANYSAGTVFCAIR